MGTSLQFTFFNVCSSAYWLEMVDNDKHLVYLNLSRSNSDVSELQHQTTTCLSNIIASALTLDPLTGDLWVSNYDGGIFNCTCNRPDEAESCQRVVDASSSGMYMYHIHVRHSILLDSHCRPYALREAHSLWPMIWCLMSWPSYDNYAVLHSIFGGLNSVPGTI